MKPLSPYLSKITLGLPAYCGGKRKLFPWIFGALGSVVSQEEMYHLSFTDAFAGGGSVSLCAKALGFRELICNDRSERSQVVLKALIENESRYLSSDIVYRLLQPCEAGYIRQNFAGSVFAEHHAEILDRIEVNAITIQSETGKALAQLLLWHLTQEFVAFATSIGTSNRPFAQVIDGLSEWSELNPKRLSDGSFGKLLRPASQIIQHKCQVINNSVIGTHSQIKRYQMDAFDLVKTISTDVLYLDPPYPATLDYESQYSVLDSILFGRQPDKLPPSPFTKRVDALGDLLVTAQHIPIWIISYGNKVIELDPLMELVQQASPERQVQGWEIDYPHFSHVSKSTNNKELLVMATCPQFIANKGAH